MQLANNVFELFNHRQHQNVDFAMQLSRFVLIARKKFKAVEDSLFDKLCLLAQGVALIVDNGHISVGIWRVRFSAQNANSGAVSSGQSD
jgi:hypothetical protein